MCIRDSSFKELFAISLLRSILRSLPVITIAIYGAAIYAVCALLGGERSRHLEELKYKRQTGQN